MPVRCSAPWPDDITWGVTIASSPTMTPPIIGRIAGLTRSRVEQPLAGGDAAHQRDAEHAAEQADAGGDDEVVHREARHGVRVSMPSRSARRPAR